MTGATGPITGGKLLSLPNVATTLIAMHYGEGILAI